MLSGLIKTKTQSQNFLLKPFQKLTNSYNMYIISPTYPGCHISLIRQTIRAHPHKIKLTNGSNSLGSTNLNSVTKK